MFQKSSALTYSRKHIVSFCWESYFLQVFFFNKSFFSFFNNTKQNLKQGFFISGGGPNCFFLDPLNHNFFLMDFNQNKQLNKQYPFLLPYFRPYWLKLVFRGKGFRIRNWQKKKKLTLNFGRSHWTKFIFLSNFWKFQKLKRQAYLIFSINNGDMLDFYSALLKVRTPNLYTRRGLRTKRFSLPIRFGKISQAISSIYK